MLIGIINKNNISIASKCWTNVSYTLCQDQTSYQASRKIKDEDKGFCRGLQDKVVKLLAGTTASANRGWQS